ncbi:hypothetical protein [Yersinia kristensenii]|uniref:NAD-dependent aldehyde Dehydrogenase n=1 Tax=Yersinia kristensenii TaxID=28152 RepID=A0A0T9LB84_YERKR|nr:hypothetical protein [Yersinia kristensenii]CNE75031.1 NAD-dependent aldehyde Dehydrogenase [Yersinia kristensenii]
MGCGLFVLHRTYLVITGLQTEHIRRISQRELAQEFGHLIEELELDKNDILLKLCASAKPYKDTHREALMAYAKEEMMAALNTLSPEIMRAIKIKMVVNEIYGNKSPERVLGILIASASASASASATAAPYPLKYGKRDHFG